MNNIEYNGSLVNEISEVKQEISNWEVLKNYVVKANSGGIVQSLVSWIKPLPLAAEILNRENETLSLLSRMNWNEKYRVTSDEEMVSSLTNLKDRIQSVLEELKKSHDSQLQSPIEIIYSLCAQIDNLKSQMVELNIPDILNRSQNMRINDETLNEHTREIIKENLNKTTKKIMLNNDEIEIIDNFITDFKRDTVFIRGKEWGGSSLNESELCEELVSLFGKEGAKIIACALEQSYAISLFDKLQRDYLNTDYTPTNSDHFRKIELNKIDETHLEIKIRVSYDLPTSQNESSQDAKKMILCQKIITIPLEDLSKGDIEEQLKNLKVQEIYSDPILK